MDLMLSLWIPRDWVLKSQTMCVDPKLNGVSQTESTDLNCICVFQTEFVFQTGYMGYKLCVSPIYFVCSD